MQWTLKKISLEDGEGYWRRKDEPGSRVYVCMDSTYTSIGKCWQRLGLLAWVMCFLGCLFAYCFTSPTQKYCTQMQIAPISVKHGAYDLTADLSWLGAPGFSVSSDGPLHLVALYDRQGAPRNYSIQDPHLLFSREMLALKYFWRRKARPGTTNVQEKLEGTQGTRFLDLHWNLCSLFLFWFSNLYYMVNYFLWKLHHPL